jgi:deoxycytidine triphosphate deaminase
MRNKSGWQAIISKDIRIHSIGPFGGKLKSAHTLKPGEYAVATVKERPNLHFGRIPVISTRSVVARHGVQVGFNQEHINEILATGKAPESVNILHNGKIPLKLRRGNRTHRIVFNSMVAPLRGNEISRLRKSGELVLGSDFKVHPQGLVEITVQPVTYELTSDPKVVSRKNWVSGSKRKEFMKHFARKKKPVRVSHGGIVLSETKYVKLPKDVGLILENTTDGNSIHINSFLIDPGFEGPIVLELFGFKKDSKPDKILAWLVRPRV